MKAFKFYIGTKAGQIAKDTRFEGWTFSKQQVVEAIERIRTVYNNMFPVSDNLPAINGYSLYTIDGYWQGVQETSYVLEVMIDDMNSESVALGIKNILHQDSVMVTVQELEVKFL